MSSSLNTLRVLEVVGEQQPIAVAEISRLLGRPKSTVQRALVTLHTAGWIRPHGIDRTRWRLTERALILANQYGNDTGLRDVAAPIMRRLRDSTRESVSLCVLDDDHTVSVEFVEGRHTLRFVSPIGVRLPLYAGSSGKVILAHLPEDRVRRVMAGPFRAFTKHTVSSGRRLASDLREIRRTGYGVSIGEVSEAATGVAAAILTSSGAPIASVAVLLPDHRATPADIEQLASEVMRAAADIENGLSASGRVDSPD